MATPNKPLPIPDLENLLPPIEAYTYLDDQKKKQRRSYTYFEHSKEHSFQFESNLFQMVNAWWLADAALLAYEGEAMIQERCAAAELPGFKFFNGESTQSFVAHNKDFAIVSFRGTQVFKSREVVKLRDVAADVLTDTQFRLVASGHGGNVHEGFMNALDEIWDRGLRLHLEDLKKENKDRTFWFTGHSLGAALATLAADRYGNVQGVYTYGSPLVGDSEFKADYFAPTYRFVNNNDIVARVPPAGTYHPFRIPPFGRYHHVGELKYIDSRHQIQDNSSLAERLIDSFRGSFGHMFNALGHFKLSFLDEIPDEHFVDHAPLYYAIHIWNNL